MDKPHVTNRIDYGHILQAAILFITVAGAILTTYFALQSQLAAQSRDINLLQWQVNDSIKRVQLLNDEQKQFAKDMAISLIKVTEQLSDLRVLIVQVRDGHRPKDSP